MFSESLRSIVQKNEGEDKFLVSFQFFKNFGLENFAVHTFYKNYSISKVK